MKPYADAVADYAQAGWPCILPVPVEKKSPPPHGFTGADGRDTAPLDLISWCGPHTPGCPFPCEAHERADWSIAIRLPDGVVGIDVDHYMKGSADKRGNDILQTYIDKLGPLPDTWSSTARGSDAGPGPSRIMFFRCPPGRYRTKLGDAIEIIQRHHRYAVVAPSLNQDAGNALYRWYGPDGSPNGVPRIDELAWLPLAWVEELREGATVQGAGAADVGSGQRMLMGILSANPIPCADVSSAARTAIAELEAAESGSRHDTAIGRVHHLVMLGAHGHPGVAQALVELNELWFTLTSGENRSAEWERMMLTSARKAVTVVGPKPVDRDPCLLSHGTLWPAPAPVVDQNSRAEDPLQVEAVPSFSWWSVRQVIGVHEFDPHTMLDQMLAGDVLARLWPALRYAVDANTWILRGPERWESRGDLTRWGVHELAGLMPRGNPDAAKGSDEQVRAERRRKLMSTAGRNAVAASMQAAVAAGTHPCALKLADLDTEPWLLWAGGLPFDLRASNERPTLADVDPGTPHLNSAALAPAIVPTPRWHAFLTAVWPDPEVRAWALRVMSIAFTGEPDAALPILQGPKRRGKSQVVSLLMSVLGSYAIAADPRLLGGADQSHASIVYALMGKRLAFVDEGPRENRWAQERLKQLTGGVALTGNKMRENPVTFEPTHTLVLTSNPEPMLTDPAVRARVRLIPCEGDEDAVRAARQAIGSVRDTVWRNEAPGVLAQMMREASRWLTDRDSGLNSSAPACIRERVEIIASEQDPIMTWVEEGAEPHEPGTPSGELYAAFVAWCKDRNTHANSIPSITAWGRGLSDLGFMVFRAGRGGVKHRALRVRQVGGWVLTPPVQHLEESYKGKGGPEGESYNQDHGVRSGAQLVSGAEGVVDTGVSPGPPASVSSVSSCFGTSTTTSNNKDHIKQDHNIKNIPTNKGTLDTVHSSASPGGSSAGQAPVDHGVQTGHPGLVVGTREPQAADKVTERQLKAAQRAANKAQAAVDLRAQRILEAAGETYPLPAVVNRAGVITSVTLAEAHSVVSMSAARHGALTVDVETTGYPIGHADYALKTIQLGGPELAVVFDARDPEHTALCELLLEVSPKLHAHSATADLVPLVHEGVCTIDTWYRMYDTVIPAKLADPQSTGSDPGLKQLSAVVLGEAAVSPAADAARKALFRAGKWLEDVDIDTHVDRSGWAQTDPRCATMIRYAACDVLDDAAIALALPTLPGPLIDRERHVQRITARITHEGLPIDRERVATMTATHLTARNNAGVLVQAYGIENPGSDRQIAAVMSKLGVPLPRTKPSTKFPEGQISVKVAALQPYAESSGAVGDLVRAVLDFRHHDTVLGTFLGPFRELIERGDGRVRPTIYTLGTDTGRMSCVRMNLQQLPRVGGTRACITADPGYLLISADLSSVEVCVMAGLSQDQALTRMMIEGMDPHGIVADMVFGPEWTKANRYHCKRGVFGWAYGGSIPSLAAQLGVSESVMAAIVDALAAIAPQYVNWATELKKAVRRGAVHFPTYAGRIIHLDKMHPHKAPNYAVQGTARELLCDGLLNWSQTRWGDSIIVPVHDQILAMVPEAEAEEATAELVRCMSMDLYGVPIRAVADPPAFAWQDAA